MKSLPLNAVVWVMAGLAALSVGLAARTLPARIAGESGLPPPPATPEAPSAAEVSVEPILAWSPFGQPVSPAAPAEETGLGLTLSGVVVAADAKASGAIVSTSAQPARAYSVGQEVARDATLAEVHGDHVVLIVSGHRETLSFPEDHRMANGPVADQVDSGVAALGALTTGSVDAPEKDAPNGGP